MGNHTSISQMQGVPSQIERVHRAEGDSKRHRSRCKYYSKASKKCSYHGMGCMGSAHCAYYREIPKEQETVEIASKPVVAPKKKESSIDLRAVFNTQMIVKQERNGRGVVASVTQNEVQIRFDKGGELKTFQGVSALKWIKIVDE